MSGRGTAFRTSPTCCRSNARRAHRPPRRAGLPRIEAVRFVRDDRVPQMAGAEGVAAAVGRREGVELSGLVLNERGWERFAAAGLDRVNVTLRRDRDLQSAERERDARRGGRAGRGDPRGGGEDAGDSDVSCAFGCPFEGRVDPGAVAELGGRFAGRAEVVLADTIGVATPSAVRSLVEQRGPTASTATTRATPATRAASPRSRRRARPRRVGRRPRRLSVLPARDRQRRDRGSRLAARREGVETGIDLDALVACRGGSRGCSAGRSRDTSTARGAGHRREASALEVGRVVLVGAVAVWALWFRQPRRTTPAPASPAISSSV